MFDNFLTWDLSGEVLSSLIVMVIVALLFIIAGIMARFHDPLKPSKGLLFVAETLIGFFDGLVEELMGSKFKGMGGFITAVASYLFIAFIFGLTGLPSPVTYMAIPLSMGFLTFGMIHITSMRFTKFRYFKRYIEPNPVFLPINLISMWAPVLSLSLRLFGNALAGFVIMSLIYAGFDQLSAACINLVSSWTEAGSWNFVAPIPAAILHCYFDLFSGFIQTTVFIFLSMILISQEAPEDELEETESLKRGGSNI